MSSDHIVDVCIYGRDYQLRAHDDPDYVHHLAEMVDARMAAAATGTKTVDSMRLAVLAALNLADEYCKIKAEYEGRIERLERERERLGQLLDSALDDHESASLPDA